MSLDERLRRQFDEKVAAHKVVLFMKGNRRSPACGFSASVVGILDELLPGYETVDVLASPEIREGIKIYSEWPTIPQLYIDGKFVGGADIVKEMHASGELAKALGVTLAEVTPPKITISKEAAQAMLAAREAEGEELHFEIDARFNYGLFFGPREAGQIAVEASGVTLLLDRTTARRADGVVIEYIDGPDGAGFKITSPHEPAKVKPITPPELKQMMDQGAKFELFDVRTDAERNIAKIPGARQLDVEAQKYLEGLDRETVLVFHCHHGMRSQAAAEHFLGQGFKKVMNLKGGIDAWSAMVDPSVPRY
ncbi:MAG: Grx4 family monothiol glutaredoxin [Minicystis sp.]